MRPLAIVVAVLLLGMTTTAGATERLELRVDGMVCPFCEATVESLLRAHPGVIEVDASFLSSTAGVVYDPSATTPEAIADAVNAKTTYRARPLAPGEEAGTRVPWRLYTVGLVVVLAGGLALVVRHRRSRTL